MSYKAPGFCPVCKNQLTITRLACDHCHTTIEGEFDPCNFCSLPKEQLNFLLTFIKCRGSIKDVEKDLGISYPTVKSKLNQLVETLGLEVSKEKDESKSEGFERNIDLNMTDQKMSDSDLEKSSFDEQQIAKEKNQIIEALESGDITPAQASQKLKGLKKS